MGVAGAGCKAIGQGRHVHGTGVGDNRQLGHGKRLSLGTAVPVHPAEGTGIPMLTARRESGVSGSGDNPENDGSRSCEADNPGDELGGECHLRKPDRHPRPILTTASDRYGSQALCDAASSGCRGTSSCNWSARRIIARKTLPARRLLTGPSSRRGRRDSRAASEVNNGRSDGHRDPDADHPSDRVVSELRAATVPARTCGKELPELAETARAKTVPLRDRRAAESQLAQDHADRHEANTKD